MKNSLRRFIIASITATSVALAASTAAAAVPATITHQGRLYTSDGSPVAASLKVTFTLYDGPDAGAGAVWSEQLDVPFDEGYFSVELGAGKAFDDTVFNGSPRYLGIQIEGDSELTPRAAVRSVPYALVAGDVNGPITPDSVSIKNIGIVIDENGQWKGDPAGLQGPEGPQGPAGLAGATGATGAAGPAGPAGAAGPTGATGAQGPQGPMGLVGSQGAQGVQGVQGPAGPAGATGATGTAGTQGPSGVVTTGSWAGFVSSIAGSGTGWVFAGPFATVTTTATQRLTGAAEAPLGLVAGSAAQSAEIDLCYQPSAGGTITNFSGGGYSVHRMVAERRPYVGVGSVVPGAGTWRVGLCVYNFGGAAAISDNDYVNGYVQVTN